MANGMSNNYLSVPKVSIPHRKIQKYIKIGYGKYSTRGL